MKALYHAHAFATGGRTGHAETDDGKLNLTLSTPKELGGDSGPGTNPEQLFAAGYSACFLGAMKFVAGQAKIKIPEDTKVSTKIGIGPRDDGEGFGITADMTIKIPGMDHEEAKKLVHKASIVCPYAHATKGNVHTEHHVEV
jgi:Ohr subfamily peroxiredoxin